MFQVCARYAFLKKTLTFYQHVDQLGCCSENITTAISRIQDKNSGYLKLCGYDQFYARPFFIYCLSGEQTIANLKDGKSDYYDGHKIQAPILIICGYKTL